MTYTQILAIGMLAAVTAAPARAQQAPPAPPAPSVPPTVQPAPAPKPPKVHISERSKGRFEEVERQTLKVAGVTELELSNISGDIVITVGSGRDATIEVTKRGYGDSADEAREQLSYVEARLNTTAGGRGDIRVHHVGGRRNHRSSVEFRVTTPAPTRIRARSISGNVSVAKVAGEVTAETVSGNVTIDAAGRVTLAKSISGDIALSGAAGDEPLVLSSVSGSVRLRGVRSREVDVNSVSGNISAHDITCDRAALQTISGDVEYAGPIARGGRYELRSHSGSLRLVPAGDTGFSVDASSFSGAIRTDVPIKSEAGADYESAGSRRAHQRTALRGTYKDGSARLELTTFSGNITIAR